MLRVAGAINEFDRHARVRVSRSSGFDVDDSCHFTVDDQRPLQIRHHQPKHKFCTDGQRSGYLNKRASPRDVFGVVSEERVESLVLNLKFNRLAHARTPVFFTAHRGLVVGSHATLYLWPALRSNQAMTSSTSSFNLTLVATLRRSIRLRIAAGVALLVGVALLQSPLFATLGFEHALASAVFASCIGIDTGGWLARIVARRLVPVRSRDLLVAAAAAIGVAVSLTLVPILVAAIAGFWRPTCDWGFGLVAEFGMPILSAVLGAVVGFVSVLTVGGRRPFSARVAPWLVLLATALHGLWRFYAAPPVFSYNPLVGYFPGNLYDEDITLTAAFWWARLDAGLLVTAMLAFIVWRFDFVECRVQWRGWQLRNGARRACLVAVVAAAAFAGLRSQAGTLGYSVSAQDIDEALGSRVETEHFVIHFDRRAGFASDINLIAADHEFRYRQVTAQFGIAPSGKIHSYYFATTSAKARWMGARDVEMAKPWRQEIYLDHRDFPHASLRHEIAHIIAGAAGDPWFAVSARRVLGLPLLVNPGLIEGMAVALDWPGSYDRSQTPHQAVRVMQAMGVEPRISDLLSLGFLSLSSARSYTTAGSFLRYLLDTYGAAKVRSYYQNGGDLEAAFGIPAAEVVAGWRSMLATIKISDEVIAANKERFRGGSVFSRPCPHAIAKAQRNADAALDHGDVTTAVAELRDVCNQDPGEPRHRLTLAAYLAAGDTIMQQESTAILERLADDAKEVAPAIRIAALQTLLQRRAQKWSERANGRREVLVWGEPAEAQTGADEDLDAARRYLSLAEQLPADDGVARQLSAIRLALTAPGLFGQALRGYFFATNPTTEHRVAWATAIISATPAQSPAAGIGWYLRGLRYMDQARWVEASADLQHGLTAGLPSDRFVTNAARRLAVAAYRANDDVGIAAAIAVLQRPSATDVDHLVALDWQARLRAPRPTK